ncbi:hypothetical protein K340107D12_03680 [Blautia parvula]|uniref:Uncharacterized protein n=1 Tax=Blautia parvula TaxID=2877527 RepID=A0ABQ0BM14_9FIRM
MQSVGGLFLSGSADKKTDGLENILVRNETETDTVAGDGNGVCFVIRLNAVRRKKNMVSVIPG